ncbi:MAG TPA: HIT family protein [Gemmatimonadaceae bacterium]|nr:HIT family protein [Gemmatimonadaceae bacterium]
MPRSEANCPFCEIIHGAAEVSLCYEDASALAFMDIQPVNPGHLLVVPREHYESLSDVPPHLGKHLFDVVTMLGPIVRNVSGAEGMNIIVNSGAAAGQDVFHYHIHVIPRRAGDGFEVQLPFPGSDVQDRQRLDAMAARIIAAFSDPASATPRPHGPDYHPGRRATDQTDKVTAA